MLRFIVLSWLLEGVIVLYYLNSIVGQIFLNFLDTVKVIPLFVQLCLFSKVLFVVDLVRSFLVRVSLNGYGLSDSDGSFFRKLIYVSLLLAPGKDNVFELGTQWAAFWIIAFVTRFTTLRIWLILILPDLVFYFLNNLFEHHPQSEFLTLIVEVFTSFHILF